MAILTTNSVSNVAKPPPGGSSPRLRAVASVQAASPAAVANQPNARHSANVQAAAPLEQAQAATSELDQVRRAIDRMKQSIKPSLANSLEFHIDQSSGKTIVRIMDVETNTVVRQIPSEEMLAIASAFDRMEGRGGLVRQQA